MTEPDESRAVEHVPLDLPGAAAMGLIGGLFTGSLVGVVGTALRDLMVQHVARDTAAALEQRRQHVTHDREEGHR